MTMRSFHAPGRVNLIGEHTDYSGGLVLPAALEQGITITVEQTRAEIVLESAGHGAPGGVPADGSTGPGEGWGRYVAAVAAELAALGRPPVGIRGRVTSDLPEGAGLSSSAALEVALATALCAVADFPLEPLEIARACQRAEWRAVGVPCGLMDQAASVLGRADHVLLLRCDDGTYRHVPLPPDLAVCVIDSGVSRRLEGSGYSRRRAELEVALAALDGANPADLPLDEALEAAEKAGVAEVSLRRLRHVVTENVRVRQTVEALTREAGADRSALGMVFSASHASLRQDFEVTTPELDRLVDLAYEAGAVAARMTGGGFGGAIITLAASEAAADLVSAVARRYEGETGKRVTRLVTHPGPGARELT